MLMLINKDDKNKYLFNMLKDNGFTDFILENMINLFNVQSNYISEPSLSSS